MASNLAKAGFDLTCFDPSEAARSEAAAAGLSAAHTSAAAAVADADAVVTMLPNGAVCEQLFLGQDGLLAAVRPSTLVLDWCEPSHRPIHARLVRAGIIHVLHAPATCD